MNQPIRTARASDQEAVLGIAISSGLIDDDNLSIVEEAYLSDPEAVWLVHETSAVNGVVYGTLERLTEGTWNALMLAVDPASQRQGVGRALMEALETSLKEKGGRILIVETSGGNEHEGARVLYRKLGFREESRVEAYYAEGYDKVTFWKRL